jgi:hypothetical protein
MHLTIFFLKGAPFAYIDPNAGGWLFQLIFPVFVAIGGAFLVLRKKAGVFWNRLFGRKSKKPDDRK